MKSKCLDVVLALALLTVVMGSFATTTWTQLSPSYGSVAMSADARIVCSVPSSAQIRISTNWGQTWFVSTNAPTWGNVALSSGAALSADGSAILAGLVTNHIFTNWVYLSTDYGINWSKTELPAGDGFLNQLYHVACSADGTKMIAALTGGPIYFSTNTGAHWLTSSVPNTNWSSVASSADGLRIVAAVSGGKIYFSTNAGATWAPTSLPASSWKSVCISVDGKSIGAVGAGAYISKNEGASWMTNKISGNSIACSANGSNWMIAGTEVYTSSDGGVTWLTNLWDGGFIGTMSADGCEIIVAQTTVINGVGGGIWAGRTTPAPQLNIQETNNALQLSWLIPSTNFVLQQSSDLTSAVWLPVAGSPVLNFTNLNYEVAAPNTASNSFFRLIAQ